jgi:hypothetical protein
MTEISSVAKEINSNALIKKHESTVSDLSLSLSSLSTVSKPLPSMSSSASSPVALSEISVTEEVVKNKFNKNIAKSDAYDDHKIDKLEADDDDTTLFITESNEMVKHHSDLNEINESSLSEEESVRDLELFFINPVFFLYSNID